MQYDSAWYYIATHAIYLQYDTNRDGVISLSELRVLLQSANYAHDLPDDAIAKIIELADHNQDGHLHFNEFLHLVSLQDYRFKLYFKL